MDMCGIAREFEAIGYTVSPPYGGFLARLHGRKRKQHLVLRAASDNLWLDCVLILRRQRLVRKYGQW